MKLAVEIYFSDLKETAREQLLQAYGVFNESELSWDTLPITTLYPGGDSDDDD